MRIIKSQNCQKAMGGLVSPDPDYVAAMRRQQYPNAYTSYGISEPLLPENTGECRRLHDTDRVALLGITDTSTSSLHPPIPRAESCGA